MLDEAKGWMLLADRYEARGGEEFITIGNFRKDSELKVLRRTREMGATEVSQWAYIYVDNVVVRPVTSPSDCHCTIPLLAAGVHDPPLELDEVEQLTFDAVLFDYDRDELTDTARLQLDQIFKLMRSQGALSMEVSGHTDIMGSDMYNVELSRRRAEKVIGYLRNLGIAEARLKINYFGRTQPVAPNDTDEGRAQNRRVEFRVIQRRFELVQ